MSLWERIEGASSSVIATTVVAIGGAFFALMRRIFTDSKRIDLLEQALSNQDDRMDDLQKDVREIREAIIRKD